MKFTMLGLAPEQQFLQMHAFHVYDPSTVKDHSQALDLLQKY
jgi:hypothetical protein